MPRLSVIVPMYNVAAHVGACLESLRAQTYRDHEVLMVDDGSPDGSAAVAARFEAADPRFRLIRRQHGGPGAARETGLRHATGESLLFLEGDDMVPLTALELMAGSLAESDSDLVTGNVRRFSARGDWPSPEHRAIFAKPEWRTHISRRPDLFGDRLITNKLWRREFWDGLRFAEHEDMVIALSGHLLAKAVDVRPEPVYLRRQREEADLSVYALEARFAAVHAMRAFLVEQGLDEQIEAWDLAVFESDLPVFLDAVDHADDAYRETFAELTNAYLDHAPGVLARLPVGRRVKWHLVREKRMAQLVRLTRRERRGWVRERAIGGFGRYRLRSSALTRLGVQVPAEVLRLREELALQQRVDRVEWVDGKLVVEARATVRFLRPTRRLHQRVYAWLADDRAGRRIRLPVKRVKARPLVAKPGVRRTDWGGFTFAVDPATLPPGDWQVDLLVMHRGMVRKARLAGAPRKLRTLVVNGARVVPSRTLAEELLVAVRPQDTRVGLLRVERDQLLLHGDASVDLGQNPLLQLVRPGARVSVPLEVRGRTFAGSLDLSALRPAEQVRLAPASPEALILDAPVTWQARIVPADGVERTLVVTDSVRHADEDREYRAGPSDAGELVVQVQPPVALAEVVEWTADDRLILSGSFAAAPQEKPELVVSALDRLDERVLPLESRGRRFTAMFSPVAVESPVGRVPLPSGAYGLTVRVDGREFPVELGFAVPVERETTTGRKVELDGNARGHAVLTMVSDLSKDERGRDAQQMLREQRYPTARHAALREEVFFDCFHGTQFSDSPRAILEELRRRRSGLALRWNVHDGQVALPAHVEPVRMLGVEYYDALARSRFIVTNVHLPEWFRRRPGQTVVLTGPITFDGQERPMLFLAQDDQRGFDFRTEAPGPLLAGTAEVIDAIRDLAGVSAEYAERYRAFVTKFCPLDDGQAAKRVVDHLLAYSDILPR
ncbi:glycosyltransferase [Acrocarpospora sp. B8E8]|uniref:glycosyltransferase n=1 Tax=Acrocarpospora sp. B8E8 TaxID=3153572 RepID=UPI00325E3F6C